MNPGRKSKTRFLWTVARHSAVVAALGGAACSSSKAPKRSEYGPTLQQRMDGVKDIMKDKNLSMRSSFEKQIPKNSTDKAYKASAFNAKNASGIKKFSGTDSAYRAKEFADAGKKSPTEQTEAREAKEQNNLASRLFHTPDSRYDAKVSQDGGKTFSRGDAIFATGENRAGTKELEKNKKPVILQPDKPTYSEDDVKRLLNKG